MALTGKQKAALLLMGLDASTAAELLKSIGSERAEQVALELAYLDTQAYSEVIEESHETVQAFYDALKAGRGFHLKTFLRKVLEQSMGKEKAEEFESYIKKEEKKRDPFVAVRLATVDELILALENEDPSTVAIVLSELAPRKAREILQMLDEELRTNTVCRMTRLKQVGPEVRRQVASIVTDRLKASEREILPEKEEEALRRLAIVLSGLKGQLRDQLLDAVNKRDNKMFTTLRSLMLTWEDIVSVASRSLQEVLRSVDSHKLALALHGAEEGIIAKVRSNISERAAGNLDEEISLMREPTQEDVFEAREEVLAPLREANEKGTLRLGRR
ncbi:MAG: FliG C-terminal domain-containing protein [Planctomycetota bacterium]